MYTSFVSSSMSYACVVWGGTYQSDLSKLEKIQADGVRLITGATSLVKVPHDLAKIATKGFNVFSCRIRSLKQYIKGLPKSKHHTGSYCDVEN